MKHITTAIALSLLLVLNLSAREVAKHPPLNKTKRSAEKGIASAQYNMGQMYRLGSGLPKDNAKAEMCYRKAAEQGLAEAQYALGNHLGWDAGPRGPFTTKNGKFTKEDQRKIDKINAAWAKNRLERNKWWLKAAKQGYAEAQYRYGQDCENRRDKEEALKWYHKAAEQGYMWAQYDLGRMYSLGFGTPKDIAEATKWYRKAAEHGNITQTMIFGQMLRKGDRLIKDDKEAAKWLRLAADMGDSRSQFELAEMYATGEGVAKDLAIAYKWSDLSGDNWGAKTKVRVKKINETISKEITRAQLAAGKRMSRQWVEKPHEVFWEYREDGLYIR